MILLPKNRSLCPYNWCKRFYLVWKKIHGWSNFWKIHYILHSISNFTYTSSHRLTLRCWVTNVASPPSLHTLPVLLVVYKQSILIQFRLLRLGGRRRKSLQIFSQSNCMNLGGGVTLAICVTFPEKECKKCHFSAADFFFVQVKFHQPVQIRHRAKKK